MSGLANARDVLIARYAFAVAGFFGLVQLYVQRLNLSVAIVAMVRMKKIANTSVETGCDFGARNATSMELEGDFDWDEQVQSMILASFFYGYILLQLPGGRLADRVGGKYPLGAGILVSSAMTLITPFAARIHYGALMAVRFFMGVAAGCCFPAMQAMLAQWVPKAQRTVISSMVFTGSFTGTVIAMTATGVMSDSEFLGGWPSAFYVFGFSGCVWCIVWFTYIQNKPTEHPDSPGFSVSKLSGGNVIPWCAILTSPAVWSLTATQWAHTYGSYTLMTELPNYLKNILGFGLTQNGLLSGVPYLMLSVLSLLVGWAADLVRRRNIATATTIRKFCDSVSAFGPALCLMAVTATPCERTLAVFWFWLAIALISFANSGFNCTHVDMAPAFAARRRCLGLAMTDGKQPGNLVLLTDSRAALRLLEKPDRAPALARECTAVCEENLEEMGDNAALANEFELPFSDLTPTEREMLNNVDSWRLVFYITATVYTLGAVLFIAFGSAEPQEWANQAHTPREAETSSSYTASGLSMTSPYTMSGFSMESSYTASGYSTSSTMNVPICKAPLNYSGQYSSRPAH
ncbi:hypothetical protein HPB47_022103 [Ixodes persulcatus]|uniref:Uncharacterized protein n=1 Tax=Ixodes persulcatus TaxID=34615 RepID=A0AC60QAL6_IXOPE|nr:hypothetical protein HPB47_022103 [Ixodes persulcatus]